jgi:hypothetical protein
VLPGWLKPIPNGARSTDLETRQRMIQERTTPIFLREVLTWEPRWQRLLFQVLVPAHLLTAYDVDPIKMTDPEGRPIAFIRPGADLASVRFELFHSGSASEPLGELELSDTMFNQIEVTWVTVQNPKGLRYDVDLLPGGEYSLRGTAGRNLIAEEAALHAGLAPGQVRKGLRSFGWLVDRLETFMLCLNQHEYMAQPLFYHTAVLFERHGFDYVQGEARMEEIHRGFQPDGALLAKMEVAKSPFRQPNLAGSVRGRSWAIHDGILDKPWDRVRMVKRVGVNAGVSTAPEVSW